MRPQFVCCGNGLVADVVFLEMRSFPFVDLGDGMVDRGQDFLVPDGLDPFLDPAL